MSLINFFRSLFAKPAPVVTPPAPVVVKPRLVAAYFGGWDNPKLGTVDNDDRYWSNFDAFPERWPLTGRVSEDNQTIIDQHLQLAQDAGIEAFAVCWYSDIYLNYAADRMAASKSASKTKWCLLMATTGPANDPRCNRRWFLDSIAAAASRMKGDRYYKRDGKPVFCQFSVTLMDDVIRAGRINYVPSAMDRQTLVTQMHRVVSNVLAGDPTGGIINQSHLATVVGTRANAMFLVILSDAVNSWAGLDGVDAMTTYNVQSGRFPDGVRDAHSYAELRQACEQSWKLGRQDLESRGKQWWPMVMAGWDMRPWGGSFDKLHDDCLPTADEFKAHAADARTATQAASGATAFLYAFNELGEGGWVVPTKGIGRQRIDALGQHFKG